MPAFSAKESAVRSTRRPTSWFVFVTLALSGTLLGFAWQAVDSYSRMMQWTPLWWYIDKDGNLLYLGFIALIALAALTKEISWSVVYMIIATMIGSAAESALPLGSWDGHTEPEDLQSFRLLTAWRDIISFTSCVVILISVIPLFLYRRWLKLSLPSSRSNAASPKAVKLEFG